MKIITEPSVHILAVPRFFPHDEYQVPDMAVRDMDFDNYVEKGELVLYNTDGYSLIAHAGKGCYDSYGKDGRSIEDHIANLINTRHGSVFEHLHVSLFLSGISRGCSHEIVRHRHFNYSQRSTRYTSEEDAAIVLDPFYAKLEHYYNEDLPMTIAEGDLLNSFKNGCEIALSHYETTVGVLMTQAPKDKTKVEQRKWARGKARQLLPHALETRMTMTGNIRAWRWFIEERSSRHAEPEIRRLAKEIAGKIGALYPLLFKDYMVEDVDGFPEFTTPNKKI